MEEAKVFTPTRSKYLVFTADYLLPVFLCLSVIGLVYFSLYSPFFRITRITCSLDYKECGNQSILSELDKLKGQNIFTLKTSTTISRLTSGDFTIRQAKALRSLPGTIAFELQSVYPVVALKIEGDETWVVLDSSYRVIGTRDIDPNVPTVIVSGPLTLTVGKEVSDELLVQTLSLAVKLGTELPTVKTVTLENNETIRLKLGSGIDAILSPKKDEQIQLRALQAVLSDATITAGVKTIDVRFSQPVLR